MNESTRDVVLPVPIGRQKYRDSAVMETSGSIASVSIATKCDRRGTDTDENMQACIWLTYLEHGNRA